MLLAVLLGSAVLLVRGLGSARGSPPAGHRPAADDSSGPVDDDRESDCTGDAQVTPRVNALAKTNGRYTKLDMGGNRLSR